MTVAMADGSLGQGGWDALIKWVQNTIDTIGPGKQQKLVLFNEAMQDTCRAASDESLTLSESTSRLNEIGDEAQKSEALRLAYLVMNADVPIELSKCKMVREITERLGFSAEKIKRLEKKLRGLRDGDDGDDDGGGTGGAGAGSARYQAPSVLDVIGQSQDKNEENRQRKKIASRK